MKNLFIILNLYTIYYKGYKILYIYKTIKITEIKLSAFIYKLFHEDFSPIVRTNLDYKTI